MKLILYLLLAALIAMFLFPPWETTLKFQSINKTEHSGYHFILSNPEPTLNGMEESKRKQLTQFATIAIDYKRLFTQAIPLLLVAAAIAVRRKKG
ncbi:MAG: hypothetical protein FWC26_02450 [Fibromonadales bacterium]|nr:hypothetical protein [Fibromonadales bacterium]